MTPLAHLIAADSTLPKAKRRFGNAAERLHLLDGVHFFECTQVMSAASSLLATKSWDVGKAIGPLAFLPAPKTWIETCFDGVRVAILLTQCEGKGSVVGTLVKMRGDRLSAKFASFMLYPHGVPGSGGFDLLDPSEDFPEEPLYPPAAFAMLGLINTPRIIGRKTHLPHAGLQRKLAATRGMVGKFPLQAWTEIVLEVTPPKVDGGEPHETRLTGAKALHFVRCHLRIRLGRLELVSPHWRGDPALGIKQSRYRLAPPSAGRAA